MQYAFKNDFVNFNVADKVDRPKTEGYKARRKRQDWGTRRKLARLEEQLRQKQEDEEYQEWLKEKEERRKRKRQSDMEM